MRASESDTAPEASMLLAGADCTEEWFVSTELNKWISPTIVLPVQAVEVSDLSDSFRAPFPSCVLSENIVSPQMPSFSRVVRYGEDGEHEELVVARALIVISELSEAFKSTTATSATAILFDAPATGVLCLVFLLVKLASLTFEQYKLDITSRIMK
jgi:hypothetical protein